MLSVEEAQARILAHAEPRGVAHLHLLLTQNRVLAEDIMADSDAPPFDNSAVDGFAVRAADTVGAGPDSPVVLPVAFEVAAGDWPAPELRPGACARIFTGAPMPPGADALVMVEDTRPEPNGMVGIYEAARPGRHIRRAGEDIRTGDVVLKAGTILRPYGVSLLASQGRIKVPVYRQPRVAVLTTGDEIVNVEEGVLPPPGKLRNSNRYALKALVQEAGGWPWPAAHVPDDLDATAERLRKYVEAGAAVIVTAGGVSMGERDYVKPALERLGTLDLWQVRMKPGKPLAFGRIGETLFFGLPGNPVSALVTFTLFVRPALRKMLGFSDADLMPPQVRAVVTEAVSHAPGRREYVRAVAWHEDGVWRVHPAGGQGSHQMSALAQANALLVVPETSEGLPPGAEATVLLLD